MLSRSARPQLDSLALELRAWERTVPARCLRFHEIGAMLDRELRQLSRRFWVDAAMLDSLREGAERLRGIAGDLTALAARCDGLLAEVRQLEACAADLRGAELAAWLRSRCAVWATALARQGADCQRRADLLAVHETLGRIEDELRWLGEATRWCRRAEAVLAVEAAPIDASALAGAVAELTAQILQGCQRRDTRDGLGRIRELVPPLEDKIRDIKDPPRELQTVAGVLDDLWGWSSQLGAAQERVSQLEERRNFVAADWHAQPAEEIQILVKEAEALRQELLARGRDLRQARLQDLETEVSDLFQACGRQPGIEERLASLKAKPADRPPLFRDWMAAAASAAELFRAIAGTQQGALEARLAGLAVGLGQRLAELRGQPLSDAVRQEADILEHRVRQLAETTGVEAILRALRQSGGIERELTALALRAGDELAGLAQERERLRERNRRLQAAAAMANAESAAVAAVAADSTAEEEEEEENENEIGVTDFGPRIEALTHAGHAGSLEEERRLAAALHAELASQDDSLARHCRERLAQALAVAAAAAAALERAGAGPAGREVAAAREMPPAGGAPGAVTALQAGRRLAADLGARVRQSLDEVQARRGRLAAELEVLRPETLNPAEREAAARLAGELADTAGAPGEGPVAALERVAAVVARAAAFLARRQAEEREARHGLAELRRRLAAGEDEQLGRYCPELAERVTALAYGIPAKPRHWPDVKAQVELGLALQERLEAHARRRAAAEVEEMAASLRDGLRRRLDPPLRATLGGLLAELDAAGHGALPPATLRQRLREAQLRCC